MKIATNEKEFFVWVDPDDWMVNHNIGIVGGVGQEPPSPENTGPENLMFVFNPNHKQGDISRFHLGIINNYRIEYDLESFRHKFHPLLPSRLFAMYLFETREQASLYHSRQQAHVGRRVLKRGITSGPYVYSIHDSAWIDFLRAFHVLEADTLNVCWNGYWRGERMQDGKFESRGKPWIEPSIMEALFYGRINFPNKNVSVFD
jgi:hypothetical protein